MDPPPLFPQPEVQALNPLAPKGSGPDPLDPNHAHSDAPLFLPPGTIPWDMRPLGLHVDGLHAPEAHRSTTQEVSSNPGAPTRGIHQRHGRAHQATDRALGLGVSLVPFRAVQGQQPLAAGSWRVQEPAASCHLQAASWTVQEPAASFQPQAAFLGAFWGRPCTPKAPGVSGMLPPLNPPDPLPPLNPPDPLPPLVPPGPWVAPPRLGLSLGPSENLTPSGLYGGVSWLHSSSITQPLSNLAGVQGGTRGSGTAQYNDTGCLLHRVQSPSRKRSASKQRARQAVLSSLAAAWAAGTASGTDGPGSRYTDSAEVPELWSPSASLNEFRENLSGHGLWLARALAGRGLVGEGTPAAAEAAVGVLQPGGDGCAVSAPPAAGGSPSLGWSSVRFGSRCQAPVPEHSGRPSRPPVLDLNFPSGGGLWAGDGSCAVSAPPAAGDVWASRGPAPLPLCTARAGASDTRAAHLHLHPQELSRARDVVAPGMLGDSAEGESQLTWTPSVDFSAPFPHGVVPTTHTELRAPAPLHPPGRLLSRECLVLPGLVLPHGVMAQALDLPTTGAAAPTAAASSLFNGNRVPTPSTGTIGSVQVAHRSLGHSERRERSWNAGTGSVSTLAPTTSPPCDNVPATRVGGVETVSPGGVFGAGLSKHHLGLGLPGGPPLPLTSLETLAMRQQQLTEVDTSLHL